MTHLGRGSQVQQPMYLTNTSQTTLMVSITLLIISMLHIPIISHLRWVCQMLTIFIMLTTTGIPIIPHPPMTMIIWMMRTTAVLDRIVITSSESLTCNTTLSSYIFNYLPTSQHFFCICRRRTTLWVAFQRVLGMLNGTVSMVSSAVKKYKMSHSLLNHKP